MLVLTRQKLPILERADLAGAEGLLRGAYVLAREEGKAPQVILIASGSEVALILSAKEKLASSEGVDARVVSMPSWELFREQPQEYRDEVLPPDVKIRLAVEAGSSLGWCEWVGDEGAVLGVNSFGASAPGGEVLGRYGFNVDRVVEEVKRRVG
jgi:transketolase